MVSFLATIGLTGIADAQGQIAKIPILLDGISQLFSGDFDQMLDRRLVCALAPRSQTDFFLHKDNPAGLQADPLREYEKLLNAGRSEFAYEKRPRKT